MGGGERVKVEGQYVQERVRCREDTLDWLYQMKKSDPTLSRMYSLWLTLMIIFIINQSVDSCLD